MKSRNAAKTSAVVRTMMLDENCTGPFSPETAAQIVQELVKYFLFMRCQIPGTFDELCWHLNEHELQDGIQTSAEYLRDAAAEPPAKRVKTTASKKKLIKTIASVQQVLHSLGPQLLSLQSWWWISLRFGASPQRPLECYDFKFSVQGEEDKEEGNDESLRQAHLQRQRLARRIIRSLVALSADIPEGKASRGPTKLFILIRYPATEETPPGFLPKRNIPSAIRKGMQIEFDLCGEPAPSGRCSSGCKQEPAFGDARETLHQTVPGELRSPSTAAVGEEMIWFQCSTKVVGSNKKQRPAD